ncbi:MAG: hypothetical protein OEY96_00565 [Gammaproteobacteria bacterium]|nr:hypothetical protein [Gammaproteobacteria bacterium]
MLTEKVLITVKTYPVLSETYDELVCTAGLREDGSWIRLYPIQFRQIEDYEKKYKKWEWIEIEVEKNKSDHRVESFRPIKQDSIKVLKRIGTEQGWYERKKLILENSTIYRDLSELIQKNKEGLLSLATFSPVKILDLVVEEIEREWDKSKIELLKAKLLQGDLFNKEKKPFKIVDKLPYKFSYKIEDVNGKESKMMIEDWELGALYWKSYNKYKDEQIAIEKVKEKYLTNFLAKNDIYLFLGTTKLWDKRAPNPFVIIGVFYPPKEYQKSLF